MFHWYVINTYSGHENKVRQNLLHRVETMSQQQKIRRVVVPTEQVVETKDGQKVQVEKRTLPGYVLVHMELDDDSWHVVKNTPGVTGFVGAQTAGRALPGRGRPHPARRDARAEAARRPPSSRSGETVKVTSGPLSDFDGEIIEVNAEAGRLKVAVSIFERSVPVDLTFDQVKRLD